MEENFNGIIRRVDELGRIVLPREMRKMLDVREGCQLQIGIVEGDKFLLSKYMPMNNMDDYAEVVLSAIGSVVEHDVLICNLERVLSSNKKKFFNKMLHGETQDALYKRDVVVRKKQDDSKMIKILKDVAISPICELISPIIKNDDVIGGIIVVAVEDKCFDEGVVKVVKSYCKFLSEILK